MIRTSFPLLVLSLAALPALAQNPGAAVFDDRELERRLQEVLERAQTLEPERTMDAFLETGPDLAYRFAAPEPGAVALDAVSVHERLARSTLVYAVRYKCPSCTRWHLRIASAFAVAKDGVVATNHHVIETGGGAACVMDATGRTSPVLGIVADDPANDLALLRVAASDLVPLPVSASVPPPGSEVFVLSHPANQFFVFTRGMVSRRSRAGPEGLELLEITADFARGSSGAPVADVFGNVVSVVKATRSIYYEEHPHGASEKLQMVMRHTIPSTALRKLLAR